jgi:hypothetical protein
MKKPTGSTSMSRERTAIAEMSMYGRMADYDLANGKYDKAEEWLIEAVHWASAALNAAHYKKIDAAVQVMIKAAEEKVTV